MVNVLPKPKRRAIRVRYYVALATSALYLLAGAALLGGVFLIPSYLASKEQAASYERYRDALAGALNLRERDNLERELAALAERIRIAESYGASSFSVPFFETIEATRQEDVAIQRISFGRNESGVAFALAGVAEDRAALLSFVEVLRTTPRFSEVTLPVAQLVTELNPPFSLQGFFEYTDL